MIRTQAGHLGGAHRIFDAVLQQGLTKIRLHRVEHECGMGGEMGVQGHTGVTVPQGSERSRTGCDHHVAAEHEIGVAGGDAGRVQVVGLGCDADM